MAIGDKDMVVTYEDGTPVLVCEEVTLADFIRNMYLQRNQGDFSFDDSIVTNIMIHNQLHSVEMKVKPLQSDEPQRLQ